MYLGHHDYRSTCWREGAGIVMALVQSGAIQVSIEGFYGLDQAEAMFAALESGQTTGKLIPKTGPI